MGKKKRWRCDTEEWLASLTDRLRKLEDNWPHIIESLERAKKNLGTDELVTRVTAHVLNAMNLKVADLEDRLLVSIQREKNLGEK